MYEQVLNNNSQQEIEYKEQPEQLPVAEHPFIKQISCHDCRQKARQMDDV